MYQNYGTYQKNVNEHVIIKDQRSNIKLRIFEIVFLKKKSRNDIVFSCFKKFTTENNVETKQPRHENLGRS